MNAMSTIRTANQVLGRFAPAFTADVARRLMMRPQQNPPRSWELDALDSAERITLRFGLSALRWGTHGPVVLALHGWRGRPTQFARFAAPIVASGRQLIALEAPGHGRSPGRESNVVAFAQALHEAAAELRGLEALVGHSMGGGAAMLAVAEGLPVERAVVIGAPAALTRVLDRYADAIALPANARQAFLANVDRHVGVPAAAIDSTALGHRLVLPGLVVHDRDDDMVPFAEGESLARDWRGAEFLATEGLGHRQVLADARVIERVMAFLDGRAATRSAA